MVPRIVEVRAVEVRAEEAKCLFQLEESRVVELLVMEEEPPSQTQELEVAGDGGTGFDSFRSRHSLQCRS